MDKDTQSWLVGVPFDTVESGTRRAPVLSARHKRELASVTGLVMASIAFFLTPLLLSSPTDRPQLVAQSAAVAESTAVAESSVDSQSPATSTVKRVTAAGRGRHASASRKAHGRLFRAFVGDGRYRVKPFPTPVSGD